MGKQNGCQLTKRVVYDRHPSVVLWTTNMDVEGGIKRSKRALVS